jgi:hypothetical protein
MVGKNDIVADKDYKHVFKCLCNTILWQRGMTVNGTIINSATIYQHLMDNGVPQDNIKKLLNLNDRQDVPVALSLLIAIWKLPKPTSDTSPVYARV